MQNKTVLITGATSGIGAAYARKYAGEGRDLVITGRRREKIEAQAEAIRQKCGVRVDVVLAELSEEAGVQKVIEAVRGREIEILVNNAGFGVGGLYQECDMAAAEQLAKVNVLAPMELIRAVLPGMMERHSGTIINVSSESVFLIMPGNAVYSGAKAFLKSFTEGLSLDLRGTGVRAIAVCPGLTHTDFHEKMGMAKSRQVDKGLVRWMPPEAIVEHSLRDLEKGKVISIPGTETKLLAGFLGLLPRKAYYNFMYGFCRRNFKKEQT